MYNDLINLIDDLDTYYSRLENVGYIPYQYVDKLLVSIFKAEFK